MQKLFNHILVPVDFSAATPMVADRAADMAVEFGCSVLLLHVAALSPFVAAALPDGPLPIPYAVLEEMRQLEQRMQELERRIRERAGKGIAVMGAVRQGHWLEQIRSMAVLHRVDLVLMGHAGGLFRKKKFPVNPDTVTRFCRIPVITVSASRMPLRVAAVVVPVTDFLPVRKLIYAVYIASKSNGSIRLLGIDNRVTRGKVQHYLSRAYELIAEHSALQVQVDMVAGENVASAVQQFTTRHPADLVILNPGTQTLLPGFFAALWGKVIHQAATPPVLTVTALGTE